MSIIAKTKTLIRILQTRGLKGLIQVIYAKFSRTHRPDEVDIVYRILQDSRRTGLMIDVGAHHGSSLAPFAADGWQVIAFEPDSNNRSILTTAYGAHENVIIDPRACSDKIQPEVILYSSAESTGVSGLSAFLNTHQASEKVSVTTLTAALETYALSAHPVDFLKVDTEGFDLMVLQGYPWETGHLPRVILCEFEDTKTQPLGYDFHDLANFLVNLGYQLMISEWYPVKVYGGVHRWRRFATYPCQLADPAGWGNIIAVKDPTLFRDLHKLCQVEASRG
jgi:FkbM family methyltransferase